eukprot:scaffold90757_cov32-Tisochrysis_lutea.AAC.2
MERLPLEGYPLELRRSDVHTMVIGTNGATGAAALGYSPDPLPSSVAILAQDDDAIMERLPLERYRLS